MNPGIYDVDAAVYHADELGDTPTLSASVAKILVNQSPAHAKAAHPRLTPQERVDESRYDVGNVSHSLFLQGIETAEIIVGYDDWKKQAARDARDLARSHGRVPLLQHQAVEVTAMVTALTEQLANLDIDPPLFTDGKPEQTLVWEEQGVMCRARLDWLRDNYAAIDDLKTTTRSASPASFSKTLYSMNYHVQARMYQRAVAALTGREPEFRFCVVETSAPFALTPFSLTPAGVALADAQLDSVLATWKRCLERDEWPAYPARICYAEPPGWAEAAWLEREAMVEAA